MTDEQRRDEEQQIARDLQALRTDADPNPAFADELFAQLQDEAVARRGTGRAWVLLAAATLVAALGVGAALGSGLVRLPMLIADASPTPTVGPSSTVVPSAEPTSSPRATSEPSPSASAAETPAVSTGPSAGDVVRILVTGLALRADPGLDGGRFGALGGNGTQAFVVDGPVVADGYEWYQLAGLGIPPYSGCVVPPDDRLDECPNWIGWVAGREDGGEYWIEPVDLDCEPSPMNLQALVVGAIQRLACYPSDTITVRGWWPELSDGPGNDAECLAEDHPSGWLLCQNLNTVEIFSDPDGPFAGIGIHVNLDPSGHVAMPERGQWVELVGHFDDPAAQGCDEAASLVRGAGSSERVVLYCRAELVVDGVTPVDGPF